MTPISEVTGSWVFFYSTVQVTGVYGRLFPGIQVEIKHHDQPSRQPKYMKSLSLQPRKMSDYCLKIHFRTRLNSIERSYSYLSKRTQRLYSSCFFSRFGKRKNWQQCDSNWWLQSEAKHCITLQPAKRWSPIEVVSLIIWNTKSKIPSCLVENRWRLPVSSIG